MSSIYSLSALNSNNSSINNKKKLSESTKMKLKSLGIDISNISSESEAKKVIAEEEAKKSGEVNGTTTGKTSAKEESLFIRIKNLARKLGISVSENENIETIFVKIEKKLEEIEKNNNNNSNINVLRSEFEMLKQEFKNITTGEASILNAMDMMAQSNRAAFGI